MVVGNLCESLSTPSQRGLSQQVEKHFPREFQRHSAFCKLVCGRGPAGNQTFLVPANSPSSAHCLLSS